MIKDLFGILVFVNVNVIKIDIDKYLEYENCKYRKKIAGILIDECTGTIEEVKLANITLTENEINYKYSCCKLHIVFMMVVFTIFTGITIHFVHCNWSFIKNSVSCIKFNARKETEIW